MKKTNLVIRKLVQINLIAGTVKPIDLAGWKIDDDLVDKYFPELLKYCKENYYLSGLKTNRHLLEKMIETNNITIIGQFDESLFDRKLFNKYGKKLIPVFYNERYYFLSRNNELFNYCIENNNFEIMHVFGPTVLTEERIEKYKERLLEEAEHNPFVLRALGHSPTFLKYVLQRKKYNLLFYFQDDLFNDESIQKHKKDMIKAAPFGVPLKRTLLHDYDWFKYAVQENRWDLVIYFSSELLTEEFISHHLNDIDKVLNNSNLSLSNALANSNVYFAHCLETKQYKLIDQFNLLKLSKKTIYQYETVLVERVSKKDVHLIFGRSESALRYVLDHHLDHLVGEFRREIFTKEIIEQYGEQIAEIYKNKTLSDDLRDCDPFFNYCLYHNKPELISKFYGKYFCYFRTDEYIEYISKLDYLPSAFRKIDSIYTELLARKNYKLVSQMSLENNDIAKKIVNSKPLDPSEDDILNSILKELKLSKEEFYNKLRTLYKKNNECLRTLNIYLLGKKYDSISLEELEKFSLYPDLQENIIKLNNKELALFSKMIKYISSKNSKYDTTSIIYIILSNIKRYDFLIKDLNIDSLDDETINKLIIVIKNPENYCDVKTLDDVNNIYKLENDLFKKVKEDILNGNRIKKDYLREMLILKCFGLTIEEAQFINTRYCSNKELVLNDKEINSEIKSILLSLHHMLITAPYEELKLLFLFSSRVKTDIFTSLNLESGIRSEYARMYNEALYKPQEKHKLSTKDLVKMKFMLKPKTGIYMPDSDFNMQVHSLAAYYGGWSRPKNFKKEWLQPRINFHEICTCFIANDSILPARANEHKAPTLGFSHYEEGALIFSSSQDISSGSLIDNYAASILSPCQFLSPKNLINKTRRDPIQNGTIHNEVAIERRNLNAGGQFKRCPDYVVYFTNDVSKDSFTPLNRRYAQSVQAANDFGIPLVIIDRLKYAKRESVKVLKKEQVFRNTYSKELLKELLDSYLNNYVSCAPRIDSSKKEYNDYFTQGYVYEALTRILNFIRDSQMPNRQELLYTFMKTIEDDNTRAFDSLGRQAKLYHNVSYGNDHSSINVAEINYLFNIMTHLDEMEEPVREKIIQKMSKYPEIYKLYQEFISQEREEDHGRK